MDIITMIKVELAKRNMKGIDLADRLGWGKQRVYDTLKNPNMKLYTMQTIADALGCDLVIEFKPRQ